MWFKFKRRSYITIWNFIFKYVKKAWNSQVWCEKFSYLKHSLTIHIRRHYYSCNQKYRKNKVFHFEKNNIGYIEKESLKLEKVNALKKPIFSLVLLRKILISLESFYVRELTAQSDSFRKFHFLYVISWCYTLLHKKRKRYERNNQANKYSTTLMKHFEKCMIVQISTFSDNFWSKIWDIPPDFYKTIENWILLKLRLKYGN